MKIAVSGGTGVLGHHVVEVPRQRGHDVVVLTRSEEVDLTTGDGLADRLTGVDAIVDATSTQTQSKAKAEAFFVASGQDGQGPPERPTAPDIGRAARTDHVRRVAGLAGSRRLDRGTRCDAHEPVSDQVHRAVDPRH